MVNVWACAGSTIGKKSDDSIWGFGALFGGSHHPVHIADNVDRVAMGGGQMMFSTGANANVLYRKNDSSLWGFGHNHHGSLGLGHSLAVPYGSSAQITTDVLDIAAAGMSTAFTKFKQGTTLSVWQAGISGTFGLFGPNVAQSTIHTTHIETGEITG